MSFYSEGTTDMFECSIGVKQGCPASPLLVSLYLDELEALLCDAADQTDYPRLAQLLIAILLFADDLHCLRILRRGCSGSWTSYISICAAWG